MRWLARCGRATSRTRSRTSATSRGGSTSTSPSSPGRNGRRSSSATARRSPSGFSGSRRRSRAPSIRNTATTPSTTRCSSGSRAQPARSSTAAWMRSSSRATQCSRRRCGATASRRSRAPTGSSIVSARSSTPVESAQLPDGYRLRNVAGDADLERRVDVHRAAFHPSKVTVPAYRHLRTLPPYREELDLVVEAPDGSFAAYALVWLDEENGVGELEPVGTHPAHQRLGLGKAVCLEACRRLRGSGCRHCRRLLGSRLSRGQAVRVGGLRVRRPPTRVPSDYTWV